MPGAKDTFDRIILGRSDANIRFRDLTQFLRALGFVERIRGDHHVFTRSDIPEIVNVQPSRAMSKVCQVRQIRQYIYKYNLGDDLDD